LTLPWFPIVIPSHPTFVIAFTKDIARFCCSLYNVVDICRKLFDAWISNLRLIVRNEILLYKVSLVVLEPNMNVCVVDNC